MYFKDQIGWNTTCKSTKNILNIIKILIAIYFGLQLTRPSSDDDEYWQKITCLM